eukprot:15094846-Alexandrium_andersonii.AAC.1
MSGHERDGEREGDKHVARPPSPERKHRCARSQQAHKRVRGLCVRTPCAHNTTVSTKSNNAERPDMRTSDYRQKPR